MNSRATRLFSRRFVPSFTLTMALMSGFGFGVSPALAKSPEAARQVAEQSALGGDALTGLLDALADAPQGTIMGTELRDAFREAGLAETELSKFLESVGSIRKQGDQVEIRSMEGASLNASGRGLHLDPLVRMKIRKRDGQLEVAGLKGIKLSANPDSTRYPLNSAKLKAGSDYVNGTVNLGPEGRAKDLKLRFPLPKAAPKRRAPEERPTRRQPNDLIGLTGALRGESQNPTETTPEAPSQPKASSEDAGSPAPEADQGPAEDRLNLTPGESVIALDGSKVQIPEGATHWSRGASFHVPEDGENPEGRGWLRLSPHANRVLGKDVPENATHYRPTVEFHGADPEGPLGPESNGGGTPELPSSPETSPTLPTAPNEPPSQPAAPKLPKSNKPPGVICEGGVCRPRTAADDLPKLPGLPTGPKKPSSSKPSLPKTPSKPANTQPSQPSQPSQPTSPASPSDMPRTAPPPAGPPKDLQSAIARAKSEGKLILVDFYADWCGPCVNMLQTSIPALERDPWVTQNVFIVKVNIDHNKALAQQFGVRGIPDLRVLGVTSQGQVKALRRATGYQSAGAVRSMLQNAR